MTFIKGHTYKMTEEHKRKIGLKSKGRKHTLEAKEKNRLAHLGKVYSAETRKKVGDAARGKKHTDEWKRNMSLGMKGIPKSEEHKKNIKEARKRQVFSEESCRKMGASHMGEKAWNWKGGISAEQDKARHNIEMSLWRKACLQRDNFTDAKTGIRGGNLAVHHINNFSSFPELRTSLENGITLSKESHELFHKIYGRANNTREQLLEFLTLDMSNNISK